MQRLTWWLTWVTLCSLYGEMLKLFALRSSTLHCIFNPENTTHSDCFSPTHANKTCLGERVREWEREEEKKNQNISAHLFTTRFPSYLASVAASMSVLNDEGWNDACTHPWQAILKLSSRALTVFYMKLWHCEGIPREKSSTLFPRRI